MRVLVFLLFLDSILMAEEELDEKISKVERLQEGSLAILDLKRKKFS